MAAMNTLESANPPVVMAEASLRIDSEGPSNPTGDPP